MDRGRGPCGKGISHIPPAIVIKEKRGGGNSLWKLVE